MAQQQLQLEPEGDEDIDDEQLDNADIEQWKGRMNIIERIRYHDHAMLINGTGRRMRVCGTLCKRQRFLDLIRLVVQAKGFSAEVEAQWNNVANEAKGNNEPVLDRVLECAGSEKERAELIDLRGAAGCDIVWGLYPENGEAVYAGAMPMGRHRKVTIRGLGMAHGHV